MTAAVSSSVVSSSVPTPSEEKKEALPAPSPADDTVEWVLWKHICNKRFNQTEDEWKGGLKEVSHFFAHPTEEAFHMDLHHLPLPSKSFFLKTTRNSLGDHRALAKHTEYSLFQKGVRPEWEDPQCVGELFANHFLPPELLDRYWQELAHGVMEGLIDHRHVCGIRVVDKSKGKHPIYKLEVWLNTNNPEIIGKVRKQAMACIQQDEHYRFNFHFRDFATAAAAAASHSHESSSATSSN
eukprot:CAMPEP_0176246394 /NCGR_PEP_ID=MMETSP0121_2-20121125/32424_1 /TAXON_ID=160619 /ORGANISM="Kryptoperidinium foliaceum, Strain CCMP 1326" /LENGTH=238 /DNA_ID=CAMNT_0017586031 /DNA_START=114 /DNA_END=830 /DNA_ORIENTATION=+